MFNFENLKKVKEVTDVRDQKRAEQAKVIYQEALEWLKQYKKTNKKYPLMQATNKLFEAVHIYRPMVETYVWLAYIFQLLNKDDEALKYLRIAAAFDPEFPQILKLRVLIEQKHALNPDTENYLNIVEERAETARKHKDAGKTLDEKNIEQLINIANPVKILAETFYNRATKSYLDDKNKDEQS